MKNSWKKVGIGLFATTLAVTLAACGKEEKKEGAAADGKATLTISVDAGYTDYINDIKGTFEEENNVEIKTVEMDMFDQLDALSLDGPAGKAPDVMMSAYDRLGPLGQQGHLAEVTLSPEANYDEKDERQVTVDDKFYGAPAVIETLVMFYNKDLIDTAPVTFKDLEELAKDERFAFSGESGKNTGFLAKWTDFYFAYGLLAGYGGYVFGEEGTNPDDIGLNNDGSIEAIEYATSWFQETWPKGMLDVSGADAFVTDQFTTGKSAAIIGGPWAAAGFTEAGLNYGVAKIPTLNNGGEYAPFGGGKAWVVSNYSENKDVAQKFLDYVTSTENQTKFYEVTSEIPANNDARAAAIEAGNELTNAVVESYENADPMPNIPEMAEVWTGGENLMFDAGSKTKTAKEAADAAVKVIEENIQQKYSE